MNRHRTLTAQLVRAGGGAQFHLLTATGHVPWIETPDQVLRVVRDFAAAHGSG